MASRNYIGVNGVARKVTAHYIGVNGVARKVKTMYYPDGNGKAQIVWQSTQYIAATPAQSGTLRYTGSAVSPTWSGYDSTQLTLGGVTSGTNAGSYTATFTPREGWAWSDGTTTARNAAWTIAKANPATPTLSPTSLTLTGSSPTGTITVTRSGDGAVSAVSSDASIATVSVSGTRITVTGVKSGSVTVTVTVAEGSNYLAYTGTGARCSVTSTVNPDLGTNCIIFSASSAFTLATSSGAKTWNGTMQWSNGGDDWATWSGTTTLSSAAKSGTHYLYLRGLNNTVVSGGTKFVIGGAEYAVSCDGNIETLLNYNTVAAGNHPTMAAECFNKMFSGNKSLIKAPTLPGTTLANYCYAEMFYGTNITVSPALPATATAPYCYYGMFTNCTNLRTANAISATSIGQRSCAGMFEGCTSLVTAPRMSFTSIGEYGCYYMFYGCTSLRYIPVLRPTTLAQYCYTNMFMGCGVKVGTTYSTNYRNSYKIPYSGTISTVPEGAVTGMFNGTSGTFTGTPEVNTIYYTVDAPVT